MFSTLKAWVFAAIGGALAVGLLLLQIFRLGQKAQKEKQLELDLREADDATHRMEKAIEASGAATVHVDSGGLHDDDGHKRKSRR